MKKSFVSVLIIACCILVALESAGFYLSTRGQASQPAENGKTLNVLKARNRLMRQKLKGLSLKGVNLVVDTALNRLYLKDGDKTVMEAVVSCGSGNVLEEPSGARVWVFDTPRGVYSVKSKATDPVWIKPDWAFIEEGEDIPKKLDDRLEPGVLGDYAMGFGNGYFIHGTLYTRLLGRNVTHGCVRVGDKDLKTVFQKATIGTKIVIF